MHPYRAGYQGNGGLLRMQVQKGAATRLSDLSVQEPTLESWLKGRALGPSPRCLTL